MKTEIEVAEASKAANMQRLQEIHNHVCEMGADCGMGAYDPNPHTYESMYDAVESIRADEIPDNLLDTLERFVSQGERKKAKPGDFAGKGTSFPILKPEDVAAALHSIGRAGSGNYDSDTLKKNILSIAKRKGFAVPKSDESVYYTLSKDEKLVTESISFDVPAMAKEADGKSSNVLIKIIAPGWGSSAYYSKGVLKESGAKVFKKGTHMMWNHQTATEEVERPEGDLSNLAAVLIEDAYYKEDGAKGPGLYAKSKVFPDYATAVHEKGPYIGVSINAGIKCHEGEAEGRKGLIADQFVHAYSADFVTKPGAGGAPIVPVSESLQARTLTTEETDMTAEETAALLESNKKLTESVTALTATVTEMKTKESAATAENARLATVRSAISAVTDALTEAGVTVKSRLIEAACAVPTVKDGKVDADWIKGVVADFTESFATSGGKVRNMGESKYKDNDEVTTKEASDLFKALGVPEKGIARALEGGR